MSGGQQADNTLHENAIGWAIMLVIFAVIIAIFWYYFDSEVRNAVRWIRYYEMTAIKFFVEVFQSAGLMEEYKIAFRDREFDWFVGYESVPEVPADRLNYNHLAFFSALAMQPLKLVFCGILGLMAIWAIFRGPNTQYRSVLNLEGLIGRQCETFPIISPILEFNPAKQPPRPPGSPVPAELPLFAEALGPEEWLAYYQIPVPDGVVDEDAAFQAFRKQLAGFWKGPQKLAPYKQVLLAAFCLKAARKRNDADAMMGRLARCWDHKNGLQLSKDKKLLKQARAILADKKLSGETLAKCNQHAYETTALMRGLLTAREEGGVLQSAQFVWLRAHDRTLWYPLNNLGRQSFHAEALGAMSHFKCERRTSRPIPVPKMEDAIDTIKGYMKSPNKRPIPQLDYSGSTKRGVKKAV